MQIANVKGKAINVLLKATTNQEVDQSGWQTHVMEAIGKTITQIRDSLYQIHLPPPHPIALKSYYRLFSTIAFSSHVLQASCFTREYFGLGDHDQPQPG